MLFDGKPRFHLAEPGAEGGSGGGGDHTPAPASGLPPLPSASSRERIYDASDAASASEKPSAEGEPAPKETPPAKDSASSKDGKEPAKEGAEGKVTPDPEKRIKDTQAAFHKTREELAAERKEKADLKAKLELAAKYVDFDKLAEHDKTQSETDLDQPLTKRDLKAKEDAEAKEKADRAATSEKESMDRFVEKFVTDNPHVKPYIDNGEAKGVYELAATRIWNDNPEISKTELMEKAAKEVADHFRKSDEAKRKEVARELTTRRESLDQGRTPPSGGQPGGGGDEGDETDSPSAEIARRHAIRSRAFRPTL